MSQMLDQLIVQEADQILGQNYRSGYISQPTAQQVMGMIQNELNNLKSLIHQNGLVNAQTQQINRGALQNLLKNYINQRMQQQQQQSQNQIGFGQQPTGGMGAGYGGGMTNTAPGGYGGSIGAPQQNQYQPFTQSVPPSQKPPSNDTNDVVSLQPETEVTEPERSKEPMRRNENVTVELRSDEQKIGKETTIRTIKAGSKNISLVMSKEGVCFTPEEAFRAVDKRVEDDRCTSYFTAIRYDQFDMEYIKHKDMKKALTNINKIIDFQNSGFKDILRNLETKGLGELTMVIGRKVTDRLIKSINRFTVNGSLTYDNDVCVVKLKDWSDIMTMAKGDEQGNGLDELIQQDNYPVMIKSIIGNALYELANTRLLDPNNTTDLIPIAIAMDSVGNNVSGTGYLATMINPNTTQDNRQKYIDELKEKASDYSFLSIPRNVWFTNIIPFETLQANGLDSIFANDDMEPVRCIDGTMFTECIRKFGFQTPEYLSKCGIETVGRKVYLNHSHKKDNVESKNIPVFTTQCLTGDIYLSINTKY